MLPLIDTQELTKSRVTQARSLDWPRTHRREGNTQKGPVSEENECL